MKNIEIRKILLSILNNDGVIYYSSDCNNVDGVTSFDIMFNEDQDRYAFDRCGNRDYWIHRFEDILYPRRINAYFNGDRIVNIHIENSIRIDRKIKINKIIKNSL